MGTGAAAGEKQKRRDSVNNNLPTNFRNNGQVCMHSNCNVPSAHMHRQTNFIRIANRKFVFIFLVALCSRTLVIIISHASQLLLHNKNNNFPLFRSICGAVSVGSVPFP